MDQAVVLVPMLCLNCNAPLPAEPDQVAWACSVCGQGLYLDDALGLTMEDIFYSASIKPDSVGKPFWVANGQVTLQRDTFGSSKNNEAQAFWSQPRRFFVPAYRAPLEELLSKATSLLLNPPTLQNSPAAHFEPVTLALPDVTAAAEFIVVSIEAGRPDKLKSVKFNLTLSDPVLWILPA